MTEVSTLPRTAESAAGVVTEFFDRYRAHDVEGMTDLCAMNAAFSYPPVELWGKQRVLRGDGKVRTIGKPLWTGLIAPAGRHYREPHLFIFHVGPDLLIDSITAYWNDAGISQQLGHTEVD